MTQEELEVESSPHQKWVRERIEELYHRTTTLQSSQLDAGQLERRMIRHEMALADLLVRVEKIAGWLKTLPWRRKGDAS